MRTPLLLCLATILTLPFTAYSVAGELPADISAAFVNSATFTLFSLDPEAMLQQLREPKRPAPKVEKFHEWPVLGKTSSLSREERKKLRDALSTGIRESDGTVAACFNPRHGIRMQTAKETIDLVICFQCDQIEIFKNGAKAMGLLTTSSPAAAFNAPLSARKIPLGSLSK